MIAYIVYETASGKPRFSASGAALPDLSAEPTLAAIACTDAQRRNPSAFMVVGGAVVDWAPTLDSNRQAKAIAAAGNFAALIAGGFTFSGVSYQIDADSQTRIAAMGIMALGSITDPANSPWPGGFYWVAADNSHVAMDAAALYAFGRAVAGYVSACVLRQRAIKDAIAGAADQAALDAIDVTAGYPAASG